MLEFIDVLDLYEKHYDPIQPLVCFDEGLKQLIEENLPGTATKPGRRERYDYEYRRNGVRNLHIFFEPLIRQRLIRITSYVAFPPAEALRILGKLRFHYTPKHSSWLNIAKIELSVYSRSLRKHVPDESVLTQDVEALTNARNQKNSSVNWQFRTEDARIKLKQLYPSIPE